MVNDVKSVLDFLSELQNLKGDIVMNFKSSYLQRVYDGLESRNAEQKEFLQAVSEVLESLEPVVAANPKLEELGVIERIVEPERIIQFRV